MRVNAAPPENTRERRVPLAVRALGRAGRVVAFASALALGAYGVDMLASERLLASVPPAATAAHSARPCRDATMAWVVASGVGRQTSYEMADAIAPLAMEYNACVVILDYGSVIDTGANVEAILGAVLRDRPADGPPVPLVLLGNNAGGIEVQREANLFVARHADRVRVLTVVADSTPSGAEDLKPPFTQDLAQNCFFPLGHLLGQGIVLLWQTYEEVDRRHEDLRDVHVLSRIRDNTEAMQAKLTMSQMCMIQQGYPSANEATPSRGVLHFYVRPEEEAADEVVRDDQAAATIDRALGGGQKVQLVPGGIHAGAYLAWATYEPAYRAIMQQSWDKLHPPRHGLRAVAEA